EEVKPTGVQSTETAAVTHRKIPRKTLIGMIIAAVVICFAAGLAGAKLYNMVVTDPDITGHQNVANDGNKPVTQEETEIASVVEKVSPSVVSIVTTSRTISPYYGAQEEDSAGTGIIISKDGYVLTNKHVID